MHSKRNLLVLGLLLTTAAAAGAETTSKLEPAVAGRIDEIFSDWIAPDEPGGKVLILRHGEEVFRGSWGLADVELGVPSARGEVYPIGSLTKQFTATAALLLVDEGKLDLDATLVSLVPGFSLTGQSITVRDLLGHTSGLTNLANIPEWSASWGKPTTPTALIDLFRRKPPAYGPRTRFEYNNSGYVLIGRMIELRTGKSWEEFLAERIFRPLGMTSTAVNDASEIVPGRVPGYSRTREGWQNIRPLLHPSQLYAAGALRSSLDDLARFHRALAGGQILSPEALVEMRKPGTLVDGRRTGYGAGWAVSQLRGHTQLEHGGASYGYYCAVVSLPETDTWGAVVTNRYGFADRARELLAQAVQLAAGWPERETPAKLAPEALARFAGDYLQEDDRKRTMRITVEGDHLRVARADKPPAPAYPRSSELFFGPGEGEELDVERDAEGGVRRLISRVSYIGETYWRKSAVEQAPTPEPPAAVPEVDPAVYVGRYQLGADFVADVRVEGGALVVDVLGMTGVPLVPTGEHTFAFPTGFGSVAFVVRDGRAVGLEFTQGGQVTRGERIE